MSAPSRLKRESSLGEEVAQRLEGSASSAPSRLKRESSPGEEVAQRLEGSPASLLAGRASLLRLAGPGWRAFAPSRQHSSGDAVPPYILMHQHHEHMPGHQRQQ